MDFVFEPLTLYVGVTGHRDIPAEHVPALERAVRGVLSEIQAQYPHCALTVLSPLADGADRLCGRAAVEAGLRLVVPTPMDIDEYKKDFDGESKQEFDALCARADKAFAVPAPQDAASRGEYYRAVGRYVAEHSHILIALWDGRETLHQEGGGTFETIQFARELDRAVCVIDTPRTGDVFQKPKTAVPVDGRIAVINELCGDISACRQNMADMTAAGRADFLDGEAEKSVAPNARRVMDVFLCADALAVKNRDKKLCALRALSAFGLAMVFAFLLYDELESNLMLFVYAGLIVLSVAVYMRAVKRRVHRKYITMRAIAEALRIQFYWGLCGISDNVFESYTFTQKEELGFVEMMLISLQEELEHFDTLMPERGMTLWIRGQLDYHISSEAKKSKKEVRNKKAAKTMLVLSVVLFVLVAAMELFFKNALETELPMQEIRGIFLMHDGAIIWRGILKIVLGTISAGTAFLANYYGNLALPQQIFFDRRMRALFEQAVRTESENEEQFAKTMKVTGAEALIESAGWYILQRDNGPGLFIG